MNAAQCRMARAALELGAPELASMAMVPADMITRLERGELLRQRTIAAVRGALEAAGVDFLADTGGGAGVRLRRTLLGAIVVEDLYRSSYD